MNCPKIALVLSTFLFFQTTVFAQDRATSADDTTAGSSRTERALDLARGLFNKLKKGASQIIEDGNDALARAGGVYVYAPLNERVTIVAAKAMVIGPNNVKKEYPLDVKVGYILGRVPLDGDLGNYKIHIGISVDGTKFRLLRTVYRHKYAPEIMVNTGSGPGAADVGDPEIQELAYNITRGVNTPSEQSKRIYDWVAANIDYDEEYYAGYLAGHAPSRDYSAKGVLKQGASMCSGYSNLMIALHRAIGIPIKKIVGPAQTENGPIPHAWNLIYIDGDWIHVDSTWGRVRFGGGQTTRQYYDFGGH